MDSKENDQVNLSDLHNRGGVLSIENFKKLAGDETQSKQIKLRKTKKTGWHLPITIDQ